MLVINKELSNTNTLAISLKEQISLFTRKNISMDTVIRMLHHIYKGNTQIEVLLDRILQSVSSHYLAQHLPKSTMRDIVQDCYKFNQILEIIEVLWIQQEVKGGIHRKIPVLKKQIQQNLFTVASAVTTDGKKVMIQKLETHGIKIKSKGLIDDYVIRDIQASEFKINPFNQTPHTSVYQSTDSKEVDLRGNISLSNFKDVRSNASETHGLSSYWLGRSSKEEDHLESNTTKLESDVTFEKIKFNISKSHIRKSNQSGRKLQTRDNYQKITVSSGESNFEEDSLTDEDLKIIKVNRLTDSQIQALIHQSKGKKVTRALTVNSVAKYEDPEKLPTVEEDKLRYPLLARLTKGLQSKCFHIMKRIKDDSNNTRLENTENQIFKFLFLVDNSGSMNGEKMILALNILIVFLETMKRLEYKTAVVRFGGEESQTTLKHFADQMDSQRGQYIIESFDASEKTLAAHAIKFVATTEELFGSKKKINEHRFILLITDGIWAQRERTEYINYVEKANARLMVFTTHPRKDKDLALYNLNVRQAKEVLESIAPGAWVGLDADDDINNQLELIAVKIDNNLRDILASLPETKAYTFPDVKMQTVPDTLTNQLDSLKYKHHGDIEWGRSIYVSDLNKNVSTDIHDDKMVESFEKTFATYQEELDQSMLTDKPAESMSSRALVIDLEEQKKHNFINELDSVLDSIVFPNNRPTRSMQDYHGPTFSLKGFIKFLCSDGQYKKIYENMIGHPRKDYLVSVIIDVSASMAGMAAIGSIQAFIGLAYALDRNNVEFNLLTAGRSTKVLKEFDQEWGTLSKARVYEALTFIDESSNLADTILFATFRLNQSSSSGRTKKTIFILTDGYASAPRRLKMSLSYAESLGIQTIGLGAGYFNDAIFEYFENYVVVGNPNSLPDGLRQLFSGDGNQDIPDSAAQYMVQEEKSVQHDGKVLTTIDEIWLQNIQEVYVEQVENAKKAIYLAIHPAGVKCSSLSFDLCFVFDSTGSMTSHIESAKRYIRTITEDVKKDVQDKCGKTAVLRVGFVTYKNRPVLGHLQNQPFTDNIGRLENVLATVRSSGGRGDEDKFDGMDLAMKFKWESTVKFFVLIGDMPGNADRAMYMPELVGRIAKNNIYLMYVSITACTDRERDEFRRFYLKEAPISMKEKGFMEVDLKNNDSDKLKDLIIGRIDDIICSEFM